MWIGSLWLLSRRVSSAAPSRPIKLSDKWNSADVDACSRCWLCLTRLSNPYWMWMTECVWNQHVVVLRISECSLESKEHFVLDLSLLSLQYTWMSFVLWEFEGDSKCGTCKRMSSLRIPQNWCRNVPRQQLLLMVNGDKEWIEKYSVAFTWPPWIKEV